jgi:hypothetical protein
MAERERLRRRLDDGLAALDLDLSDAVRDRLIAYVELLARWNAAYNLTAVRDPGEMVARHLLDSAAAPACPAYRWRWSRRNARSPWSIPTARRHVSCARPYAR